MLEIGAVLEGKVTGLTRFGAFVSFPDGSSGMVHISEVSTSFVKDIKDHLKEGQEVKVKVMSISNEGKVSLSIKKVLEEAEAPKRQREQRPKRPANVWQGQPKQNKGAMTFEEMMAQFKQASDEKLSDLKRSADFKNGTRRGK